MDQEAVLLYCIRSAEGLSSPFLGDLWIPQDGLGLIWLSQLEMRLGSQQGQLIGDDRIDRVRHAVARLAAARLGRSAGAD